MYHVTPAVLECEPQSLIGVRQSAAAEWTAFIMEIFRCVIYILVRYRTNINIDIMILPNF